MSPRPGRVFERLIVENTTDRTLTFVLEPWANELPITPGERLVIEAEGPAGAEARLERIPPEEDGYLVVWAWAGSLARVLREDGTVLDDWFGRQVPDVPPSAPGRRDAP